MDSIQYTKLEELHKLFGEPYKFKIIKNNIVHLYCVVPAGVSMSYVNLNELRIDNTNRGNHEKLVYESKMFNGVYMQPYTTSPVYFDDGICLATTNDYLLFDKLGMKYYRCIAGYPMQFMYSDSYESPNCFHSLYNTGATRTYIFAEYNIYNKINIFDRLLWVKKFDIAHIDNAVFRNAVGRKKVLDTAIRKACGFYNKLSDFKFPYAI